MSPAQLTNTLTYNELAQLIANLRYFANSGYISWQKLPDGENYEVAASPTVWSSYIVGKVCGE